MLNNNIFPFFHNRIILNSKKNIKHQTTNNILHNKQNTNYRFRKYDDIDFENKYECKKSECIKFK